MKMINEYGNLKFKLAWKMINQRRMFEIKPVKPSLPIKYLGHAREIHSLPRILKEITETIQTTTASQKSG